MFPSLPRALLYAVQMSISDKARLPFVKFGQTHRLMQIGSLYQPVNGANIDLDTWYHNVEYFNLLSF